MIGALYLAPFNPALKAGLLIFSLGAGAPFLIKLTQTAEHDLALGAAVMMLMMIVLSGTTSQGEVEEVHKYFLSVSTK